jgi:cell wall-associated NlpC family hydrolase
MVSSWTYARRPVSVVAALYAAMLCGILATPVRAQETSRPLPAAADGPFAPLSVSARALRDSIVQITRAQLGARYKRGGQNPQRGFDCSGLVNYVMSLLDLDVPRTARQQAVLGLTVKRDTSRLLPGDLLTFGKGTKGLVSHVGIYIGNGRYVHASSVAGRVIESPIDRTPSPLIKVWRGARRMLSLDDSVVAVSAAGKGG